MKIVSWNCNMAFRNKYKKVLQMDPDLLIIQECENDLKLKAHLNLVNYNQIIWIGNNPNKGIAIISFNSVNIKINPDYASEYEYIIPIKLEINSKELNVFGIWAMPHKTERIKRYIGQIWGAVNYYSNYLNNDSILLGDFNSNAIWDTKKRIGNHTDVVKFLNQKNIYSIYHEKFNCKHGEENLPTLFLLKNSAKPYHIDYCFASEKLISEKTTLEIGNYEDWIKLSDHMPLIIDNLNI